MLHDLNAEYQVANVTAAGRKRHDVIILEVIACASDYTDVIFDLPLICGNVESGPA